MVQRGLVRSREQAQWLISQGRVMVDGQTVLKSSTLVSVRSQPCIQADPAPYASRGGLKLEAALKQWRVHPENMVVMDVGASTGGFTDCLLKQGAARVYAVDVGYGQLAWHLRQDPRVTCLDRTNIRALDPRDLGEEMDLATIDVSFISLKKVLPKVLEVLKPGGKVLALVKPQFEVGRGEVGRGGIVRDLSQHKAVLEGITEFTRSIGFESLGEMPSPITGKKGNQEYFVCLQKS